MGKIDESRLTDNSHIKPAKVTAYYVSDGTGYVKLGDKIPLEFYMPKYPLQSALCLNTIATEPTESGHLIRTSIREGVIIATFGFGEDDNDQYQVVFGLDKELVRKMARACTEKLTQTA